MFSHPILLSGILRNLLRNAIDYTPFGGRVTVGCRRRGSELRIDVRDTGVGIRPEALERIFEAFERSDDTRPDGLGLGLGLFIVKRAAGLLGHRLEIRSTPGRGSCFTVVARVAGKPPRSHRLALAAASAAQRLNPISCTGEAGATGR